jgi:hypothetical protein
VIKPLEWEPGGTLFHRGYENAPTTKCAAADLNASQGGGLNAKVAISCGIDGNSNSQFGLLDEGIAAAETRILPAIEPSYFYRSSAPIDRYQLASDSENRGSGLDRHILQHVT